MMTGVLGLVLKMNEMKRPSFLKSTNKEVDNKCPMIGQNGNGNGNEDGEGEGEGE